MCVGACVLACVFGVEWRCVGTGREFAGPTRTLDGLSEGTALILGEKEGRAAAASPLSSVRTGLPHRRLSLPLQSPNPLFPSLHPVAPQFTLRL